MNLTNITSQRFYIVPDQQKALVTEQLIRKDKLAKALEDEKTKLEALKKEIDMLSRPKVRTL